jgi:hypothetical protein
LEENVLMSLKSMGFLDVFSYLKGIVSIIGEKAKKLLTCNKWWGNMVKGKS